MNGIRQYAQNCFFYVLSQRFICVIACVTSVLMFHCTYHTLSLFYVKFLFALFSARMLPKGLISESSLFYVTLVK